MIHKSTLTLVFALTIITIVAYIPSMFGKFLWDDEDFVYQNSYVQNFQINKFFTESVTAGRQKASDYYRPLQLIAYAAIHAAVGFNPLWYHTISILIHTLAGIAAFFFFKTLLSDEKVAFIGSLLFLIHPVQTESVSYISGLSDPLFVLFLFLSLTCYLKKDRGTVWSIGSVLFLVLSILSKELGIVALGVITLLEFTHRKNTITNDIGFLVIYWLVGLFYLDLRFTVLKFQDTNALWQGSLYGSSILVRLATFFRSFFAYLGLLVFPKDLFMERDSSLPIVKNIVSIWTALWIGFQLLIAASLWILHRSRSSPSQTSLSPPRMRGSIPGKYWIPAFAGMTNKTISLAVFLYGSFLLSLLPFTGIVLINGIFFEHFLYLPMAFFWVFVVVLIKSISTTCHPEEYHTTVIAIPSLPREKQSQILVRSLRHLTGLAMTRVCNPNNIFILLIVLFITRSYVRQRDWIDPIRFYRQTLIRAPNSARIINNLGMELANVGKYDEAINTYQKGISLDPSIPNYYQNMANAYLAKKDFTKAEVYYLKAIDTDKNFIFSYQSLLKLYQETHQEKKYQDLLQKAHAQFPGY